ETPLLEEMSHERHDFMLQELPRCAGDDKSSGPGELHPQALTEPDGKLAPHPALMIQSPVGSPPANERTGEDGDGLPDPASALRWCSVAATVCISGMPNEPGHVPDA